MSAHEVELGVVEPDPRVTEVADIICRDRDDEVEPYDTAVGIIEHLDRRAAPPEPEPGDVEDRLTVWLFRAGTAGGVLSLLLLVAGFGLAAAAIWTGGTTGGRLAATSALAFVAAVVVLGLAAVVAKTAADSGGDES
jgi:hypothetical protein